MSSTETRPAPGPHLPARPLSPDDLRSASFPRVAFGRRGVDEYAVARYLDRVADEVAARDDTIARLTTETRTLKHALREWHRQMVGYDGVDLVALAQQEIEEQIAQTELYTREREKEAARHYEQLVAEAHEHADEQLRADHHEQAAHQRNLVGAVLQGLEALATQVDATLQAFTSEVDRMGLLDEPDAGGAGVISRVGLGNGGGPGPFGADPFGGDPLGSDPVGSDPLSPHDDPTGRFGDGGDPDTPEGTRPLGLVPPGPDAEPPLPHRRPRSTPARGTDLGPLR